MVAGVVVVEVVDVVVGAEMEKQKKTIFHQLLVIILASFH